MEKLILAIISCIFKASFDGDFAGLLLEAEDVSLEGDADTAVEDDGEDDGGMEEGMEEGAACVVSLTEPFLEDSEEDSSRTGDGFS